MLAIAVWCWYCLVCVCLVLVAACGWVCWRLCWCCLICWCVLNTRGFADLVGVTCCVAGCVVWRLGFVSFGWLVLFSGMKFVVVCFGVV